MFYLNFSLKCLFCRIFILPNFTLPGKGGWKVERLMSRLFKEFELQDSGAGWFWWWTCCWWAEELLGCIDAFCCCSVKDIELEVSWVCRWANLLIILLLSDHVGRFSWFSEEKIILISLRRMCEIYSGNKYLMTPRVPAAIFSLCQSLKNLNFFFQKIPYFSSVLKLSPTWPEIIFSRLSSLLWPSSEWSVIVVQNQHLWNRSNTWGSISHIWSWDSWIL